MITYNDAKSIVQHHIERINETRTNRNNLIVLMEQHTLVKAYGWIFFFQTQKALETAFPGLRIIGNSPLLVLRKDGSSHFVGSSGPLDYRLALMEKELHLLETI